MSFHFHFFCVKQKGPEYKFQAVHYSTFYTKIKLRSISGNRTRNVPGAIAAFLKDCIGNIPIFLMLSPDFT
jgi:hypothetical protein